MRTGSIPTRSAVSSEPAPPPGTDVCALADVLDGRALVVRLPQFELIVVRDGSDVFGYENECRHLGVGLNLLDDKEVETKDHHMLCEFHWATYRFCDGYCVAGPCQGESLNAVPLAVRAGRVVVGSAPAAK
jgi:nitrite reductase/ring-hydroxylating ferredoxin subunit